MKPGICAIAVLVCREIAAARAASTTKFRNAFGANIADFSAPIPMDPPQPFVLLLRHITQDSGSQPGQTGVFLMASAGEAGILSSMAAVTQFIAAQKMFRRLAASA
jgi:hypothetical protein